MLLLHKNRLETFKPFTCAGSVGRQVANAKVLWGFSGFVLRVFRFKIPVPSFMLVASQLLIQSLDQPTQYVSCGCVPHSSCQADAMLYVKAWSRGILKSPLLPRCFWPHAIELRAGDMHLCMIRGMITYPDNLPYQADILSLHVSSPLAIPRLLLFAIFSPCLGYPGEGPFRIGIQNVSSLHQTVSRVSAYSKESEIDVLLLQETRLTVSRLCSTERAFASLGLQATFGQQPPMQDKTMPGGIFQQVGWGGTATITKLPLKHCAATIFAPDVEPSVREACHATWIPLDPLQSNMLVVNVYLPAGYPSKETREHIIECVLTGLRCYDHLPVIIAGDFQCNPGSSRALGSAVNEWGWTDVLGFSHGNIATFTDQQVWDDDFSIGCGKSRIDMFLFNERALSLFSSAHIDHMSPFPGHACLWVDLKFERPNPIANVCCRRPWFQTEPERPSREWLLRDGNEIAKPLVDNAWAQICELAVQRNTSVLWDLCNELALQYLSQQYGTPGVCLQRGDVPYFKNQYLTSQLSAPKPQCCSLYLRIDRLLQELLNKLSNAMGKECSLGWFSKLREAHDALKRKWSHFHGALNPSIHTLTVESVRELLDFHRLFDRKREIVLTKALIKMWKENMQKSHSGSKSSVHRWIKSKASLVPHCMQNQAGELVFSMEDMHATVLEFFKPLYNTHLQSGDDESYNLFCDRYSFALSQCGSRVKVDDITGLDLFNLIQGRSPCKAGGLDGWRCRDLHLLPPVIWSCFAVFLNTIELGGAWPPVFRLVPHVLLQKSDSSVSPDKLRPIGLNCIVYSLWSSLRLNHLRQWQLNIAPPDLHGGLFQRTVDDSEHCLSLAIEKSFSDKDPFLGVFIDRLKCFDHLRPLLTCRILAALGLDHRITHALSDYYACHSRFFRIGQAYGPPIRCQNGMVQGCALSVLSLNMLYSVWRRDLERVCPAISCSCFLDDLKFWDNCVKDDGQVLAEAFVHVLEFDTVIGQKINEDKSEIFARSISAAERFKARIRTEFSSKVRVKSLGKVQSLVNSLFCKQQTERVDKAIARFDRIDCLPLTPHQKTVYILMHVNPIWLYGTDLQLPRKADIRRLQSKIINLFWDPLHKRVRARYAVLACIVPPKIEPFTANVNFVLRALRRHLLCDASFANSFFLAWRTSTRVHHRATNGLISVVEHIFGQLAWKLVDFDDGIIEDRWGRRVGFCQYSSRFFDWFTQCSVEYALLVNDKHRHEYQELLTEHRPLDLMSSTALFRSHYEEPLVKEALDGQLLPGDLSLFMKGAVKQLVCGAIYTASRKHEAGLESSATCPLCSFHHDDLYHALRHCPFASRAISQQATRASIPVPSHWHLSSMVTLPASLDPFSRHEPWEVLPPLGAHLAALPECTVFTDGACTDPCSPLIRRAGSGFWAGVINDVHPLGAPICLLTCSQPLPGFDQSAQRAEIFAVYLALSLISSDFVIATDSQMVFERFSLLLAPGFDRRAVCRWDNADLWGSVEIAFFALPSRRVRVEKVPAHQTSASDRGCPHRRFKRIGNDHADSLARAAAGAPEDLRSKFVLHLRAVFAVQLALARLVVQRWELNEALPDADDVPEPDVKFGVLPMSRLVGKTNPLHCKPHTMNLADVVHIVAGLHHGHQLPMSILSFIHCHWKAFHDTYSHQVLDSHHALETLSVVSWSSYCDSLSTVKWFDPALAREVYKFCCDSKVWIAPYHDECYAVPWALLVSTFMMYSLRNDMLMEPSVGWDRSWPCSKLVRSFCKYLTAAFGPMATRKKCSWTSSLHLGALCGPYLVFPEAFSPPALLPFFRFASLPTSLSSPLSSLYL